MSIMSKIFKLANLTQLGRNDKEVFMASSSIKNRVKSKLRLFTITRHLLSTIITGMLLVTGGFFMMGCDKYGDAPMTQEMYDYLKKTGARQSKETDEKLTEIVKHHIPLGTPIEEALKFSSANHFDCGGPLAKKLPPDADSQYGCRLPDITGRTMFISSILGIRIYVKEGKVVSHIAYFGIYGP